MSNNEKEKYSNNLVMFPNTERILIERGYDCLEDKRFLDALSLFEEAEKLDPKNERVLIGILASYIELGRFKEAEILAESLLQVGKGDFFQVLDLYLMVLVQLESYDKVATTIEGVLTEPAVPHENRLHLMALLHENSKLAAIHALKKSTDKEEAGQEVAEILNESNDEDAQLLLVQTLMGKNIRPYLKDMQEFLGKESNHPFIQTMLLHEMREQEIVEEVIVRKLGMTATVIPAELPDIQADPFSLEIVEAFKEHLENEDPILFEQIQVFMNRHLFLLYPLRLPKATPSHWAAALYLILKKYTGVEVNKAEVAKSYRVSLEETLELCDFIEEMEQISHPGS